ncbi:GrpB family protein [Salinithrix halophila]|uniref:GrpB family protein n=1 Tax=Salinithrix halophila TaxID=1485204 RepID=A0ABV8JJV1_9BACL
MRKVEVVPHHPAWSERFEEEAQKLREVFGEELIRVYHIGSTSVPGLEAKPVIDLLPVVKEISRVDRFRPPMEALGYEAMGEYGIPGRRFFRKGGENRTHHVHVFEEGHSDIRRHLAFRDYLRTHPEEAARYGALKQRLAHRFPTDLKAYMDGKDGLIKEIEALALQWHREKHREGKMTPSS